MTYEKWILANKLQQIVKDKCKNVPPDMGLELAQCVEECIGQIEPPVIVKTAEGYALINKKKNFDVIVFRETLKELDQQIEYIYQNRRFKQDKNTKYLKSDMMKDYKKVKLIIEEVQ